MRVHGLQRIDHAERDAQGIGQWQRPLAQQIAQCLGVVVRHLEIQLALEAAHGRGADHMAVVDAPRQLVFAPETGHLRGPQAAALGLVDLDDDRGAGAHAAQDQGAVAVVQRAQDRVACPAPTGYCQLRRV